LYKKYNTQKDAVSNYWLAKVGRIYYNKQEVNQKERAF